MDVQHNATATSVGRWRVGPKDQGWGRFARALEQTTGRTAMRLSLAPRFASAHRDATTGSLNVTLRVVYLDKGKGAGRWTLSYPSSTGGRGTAMTVSRDNTGRWKVAVATVQMRPTDTDVAESGGSFDFELRSLSHKNEVFSVIEVLVNARSEPEPGSCKGALQQLCEGARRVSAAQCFVCAGQHQGKLKRAGCREAAIDRYCSPSVA